MNNNMNNGSQTWIDPITGESYPSGNPHADIKSSRVVGSAPAQVPQYSAGVYNDPLPPGAIPQPVQRVQQMPQMQQMQQMPQVQPMQQERPVYQAAGITKFCEHCGSVLVQAAVICPTCGCQVAPIRQQVPEQMPVQHNPAVPPYAGQQIQVQQVQQVQPVQNIQPVQVIVNNVVNPGTPKDKIVSLLLCIFLGIYGVHRFYEGRIGTGILWLFTFGMFGIGWLYDVIRIASAPNPYYIK